MEQKEEDRQELAKLLVAKTTLATGKNKQFIEQSADKEGACNILGIEYETYCKINNIKPIIKLTEEQQNKILKICYFKICELIDYYMDLDPKHISIIALWIIGTYLHSSFLSYPYLYFNAMRGSGKSRLMNLTVKLSKDGKMLNSMTEAVLFRTNGTLAIDEFESATSKELQALRELLNSGYKKGTTVIRMRKVKTPEGEVQQPEEFSVFRPIVIANITGLDQVLQDRCITIILDKSKNPNKVMLVENYEYNEMAKFIKENLNQCSICMYDDIKNIYTGWNNYVKSYTDTLDTIQTQYTQHTPLFNKIMQKGIYGRNLEISLPLMLIASKIDDSVLDLTLDILEEIINDKRHDEELESRDVMLIEFVSKMEVTIEWKKLNLFCIDFRDHIEVTDKEESNESIGRALKRLGLIVDKRRVSYGVDIVLNVAKAKEKIKMFQTKKD